MNNIFNSYYKEIPGNEDYYVNKHGDVIRIDDNGTVKRVSQFTAGGTVMCKVHRRSISVSRLVAELFIPNEDRSRTRVFHIDGDMWNNDITNLVWCTPSEVMKLRFSEPETTLNDLRLIRLGDNKEED